ncbi:DUF6428 family protein [Pontivivens ytuae]|uniref:Uncharacterized protein n=1 Tax=Pontivivens ytuae TaxID=2789856 RepID=A0A7S9QCD4_9RHOB|nr:DUF6428 family protein [Pontivivens ytuae]QPH53272.1 hypothetical protein I0K15_15980 [Pontivivens ytuae]
MCARPTTLARLQADLLKSDAALPVIFATPEGEIGGGYHVTELTLADIRGIDCGGRQAQWREAGLELLDGPGGAHMTAGKLHAILRQSRMAVDGLAEAPLHVLFGHGNGTLGRYEVDGFARHGDRVEVRLSPGRARCKPMLAACCG